MSRLGHRNIFDADDSQIVRDRLHGDHMEGLQYPAFPVGVTANLQS